MGNKFRKYHTLEAATKVYEENIYKVNLKEQRPET